MRTHLFLIAGLLVLTLGAIPRAQADDACADFKWDVSKERQLFAGDAMVVTAGGDVKTAPAIDPNRLYRVTLLPLAQMHFASPPGRSPEADSRAGLVKLNITAGGAYRVSLELPVWVDVLLDGTLSSPYDYQGQRACPSPHKIVVFDLTGHKTYVMQLVGTNAESLRISVTAAPARVR